MDDRRFDHLTRFPAISSPRRVVSGAMASVVLTTLLRTRAEDAAGKKKRKKGKKKKKSGCMPSCFNKVCGQDDGCGGTCTTQAGCDADEACFNGVCVANTCSPVCPGNKLCQPNGSCACPPGLKECQGQGFGDNCHECCPDAFGGDGDEDCEGSPKGAYCTDHANDGEFFLTCGCSSAAADCQNGRCGTCCELSDCFLDVFGEGPVDTGRDCVVVNQQTGEFGCQCRSGTSSCPDFTFCAEPGNDRACGDACEDCTRRNNPPLYIYE